MALVVLVCVLVTPTIALISGFQALTEATDALEAGNIGRAEERFDAAGRRLLWADTMLGPLRAAPDWLGPLGTNLAAVGRLSHGGAALADGGSSVVQAAQSASGGGITLQGSADLGRAVTRLGDAQRALDPSPGGLTFHPLAAAQRRLRDTARPLAVRAGTADTLSALAHSNGRYLLAIQNPAELRATGGLVGAWGVIRAHEGRLRLTRLASDRELPPSSAPVDAGRSFLARYGRFGAQRTLANANMSPDFPTSARVLNGLLEPHLGELDGVIAIDAVGLSYLLEELGPVRAQDVTLTEGRFVSQALVEAYNRPDIERRNLLLAGARGAWRRLRSTTRLIPVLRALGTSASEGRLLVFSEDPDVERRADAAGIAGTVDLDPPGDYLLVVGQNAGGNKLDYYQSSSLRYDVRLRSDGTGVATLGVAIRNDAPRSGLPDYVLGVRRPADPAGLARTWVSAYTASGTGLLRFQGPEGDTAESARELGHSVYSWFQPVPPGRTVRATVKLELPRVLDDDGRFRLLVQRQPALHASHLVVRLNGRTLYGGPLNGDLVLTGSP